MKAIVIHAYGEPDVLKYEDAPDPVAGPGEVLVRVMATSINPIDLHRRSGAMKEFFPIHFPGIIGVDVAGRVAALGAGVTGFAVGDVVFAYAERAYAELSVVKAATLAKVPAGLDPIASAALPLVTTTGYQLIADGTASGAGQTVLVTGALGSVGRSAVFTAKQRGATVIAGVRGRQADEARQIGADQVLATDDPAAMRDLQPVDAVADTVGRQTAEQLVSKVKPGGVFASVTGLPANVKDFPNVRPIFVSSTPNAATLLELAQAVIDGKLAIPVTQKFALRDATAAHAVAEKGGAGKVLLLP